MSDAHPVFGIEQARCLALETGDIRFLETMLSDALVYVHSTGVVNDKDSLLAYLRERVQFTKVQRANLKLFEEHGMVWLTGLMRLGGRRILGNEPFESTSFVTQIWTRDAERWLLTLLQSTRVPDEVWPAETRESSGGAGAIEKPAESRASPQSLSWTTFR